MFLAHPFFPYVEGHRTASPQRYKQAFQHLFSVLALLRTAALEAILLRERTCVADTRGYTCFSPLILILVFLFGGVGIEESGGRPEEAGPRVQESGYK